MSGSAKTSRALQTILTLEPEYLSAGALFLDMRDTLRSVNSDVGFFLLRIDFGELFLEPLKLGLCLGHIRLEYLNLGAIQSSLSAALTRMLFVCLTSARQWMT